MSTETSSKLREVDVGSDVGTNVIPGVGAGVALVYARPPKKMPMACFRTVILLVNLESNILVE